MDGNPNDVPAGDDLIRDFMDLITNHGLVEVLNLSRDAGICIAFTDNGRHPERTAYLLKLRRALSDALDRSDPPVKIAFQ